MIHKQIRIVVIKIASFGMGESCIQLESEMLTMKSVEMDHTHTSVIAHNP